MIKFNKPVTINYQLNIKTDEKQKRSVISQLGEDGYNVILACHHLFYAGFLPEVYFPSMIVGSAIQLFSHYSGISKIDEKTKTKWEKKSELFGESDWSSQILTAVTDLVILKVALLFQLEFPFIVIQGGRMGADLTTRSIRFFSSTKVE